MKMNRLSRFAAALALAGVATLASPGAAKASLVLTFTEFTDATFGTAIAGNTFTLTSTSALPTTSVSLAYVNDGVNPTSVVVTGGVLSGSTAFLGSNITVNTGASSLQTNNFSQVIDNETEVSSTNLASPRFFQIDISQNAFTRPISDPLVMTADLTQNNAATNNASSQFKGTVTTDTGSNSLGYFAPTQGSFAGPALVTNSNLNGFTGLTNMRITLNASGDSRITATGTLNVTPTPEPSTVLAAVAGLPILGLGVWMRRRAK